MDPIDPQSEAHDLRRSITSKERSAKREEAQQQKAFDGSVAQKEIDKVKDDVKGMRITGPGFSGQGPRGIKFDPNAAGAGGGGESEFVVFGFEDGNLHTCLIQAIFTS